MATVNTPAESSAGKSVPVPGRKGSFRDGNRRSIGSGVCLKYLILLNVANRSFNAYTLNRKLRPRARTGDDRCFPRFVAGFVLGMAALFHPQIFDWQADPGAPL